jgi:hypothetical protein
MAIQQLGADGATVHAIDAGHAAARVSIRPMPVLAWSSFGFSTGILPAGLAANACLLSLRYVGANILLIRRVSIGFVTTTAFNAAQRLEFGLLINRAWSAADAGGIAATVTSGRHKASLVQQSIELRVATTTGLTAGTRTAIDPHPLGVVAGGSNGLATGLVQTPLFNHDAGDHPLILQQNEGIVINSLVASGAGGAFVAHPNIEMAELLAASWA